MVHFSELTAGQSRGQLTEDDWSDDDVGGDVRCTAREELHETVSLSVGCD